MEELDKKVSEIVRSTVKEFMESLMRGEIQAFLEEREGQRNGYYERDIGTRYGKINDLRVPRDRNNEFKTALFEPYQRNIGIYDLVVSMYSKGISTRKMAEILEELFHNKYSKSAVSRITEIAVPEINKWRSTISDTFLSSSSIVYCLLGGSWRHPSTHHEDSFMMLL